MDLTCNGSLTFQIFKYSFFVFSGEFLDIVETTKLESSLSDIFPSR